MEKTDHEINKIEFEIASLKKAKLKIEQAPKKSKSAVRHTSQSLIQMIYDENKERGNQSKEELYSVVPISILEGKPVLIKDLDVYKANLEQDRRQRSQIVSVMQRRVREVYNKSKDLTSQYKKLQEAWVKKVKLLDAAKPLGKNKKKTPPRGRPALRAANAPAPPGTPRTAAATAAAVAAAAAANNRRSLLNSSDAVRSEEEFEQVLQSLRDMDNADPDSRYLHQVAEIPPLILDPKVKACRYIDTNGFVEDSFAMERERKAAVVWTEDEKDTFIKKYLVYPKRFKKISTFLEDKTTEDVVAFYYNCKKTLNLKKLLRQHQTKKRGRKPAVQTEAPREVVNLGAAVTSNYWDSVSERPRNARQIQQQKQELMQRGSKESLLGDNSDEEGTQIRTTTTAMQHGGATESRWSAREKELFIEAFVRNGKEWRILAEYIGSKTHTQCKTYYTTFNKKLHFDEMRNNNTTNDDESSFSDSEAKPKGRKGKDKLKAKKEREKKDREDKGRDKDDDDEEMKLDETEENEDDLMGNGKEADEGKVRGRKKKGKERDAPSSPTPDDGPDSSTAWTPAEKQDFIKFLALYGKNWKAMGFHITSKTQAQLQNYYDKNKTKLNLTDLLESTKDTRESAGEKKRRLSDKVSYFSQERRGPGRPKKVRGEDKRSSINPNLSPSITAIVPASPSSFSAPCTPLIIPTTPNPATGTTPTSAGSFSSFSTSVPPPPSPSALSINQISTPIPTMHTSSTPSTMPVPPAKKKGRGRKPKGSVAPESPTAAKTARSTPRNPFPNILNNTPTLIPAAFTSGNSGSPALPSAPAFPSLFNSHTPTIHIPSTIRWFRPNKESIPNSEEKPEVPVNAPEPTKTKAGKPSTRKSKSSNNSNNNNATNNDAGNSGNELNVFAEILAMGFGGNEKGREEDEKNSHSTPNITPITATGKHVPVKPETRDAAFHQFEAASREPTQRLITPVTAVSPAYVDTKEEGKAKGEGRFPHRAASTPPAHITTPITAMPSPISTPILATRPLSQSTPSLTHQHTPIPIVHKHALPAHAQAVHGQPLLHIISPSSTIPYASSTQPPSVSTPTTTPTTTPPTHEFANDDSPSSQGSDRSPETVNEIDEPNPPTPEPLEPPLDEDPMSPDSVYHSPSHHRLPSSPIPPSLSPLTDEASQQPLSQELHERSPQQLTQEPSPQQPSQDPSPQQASQPQSPRPQHSPPSSHEPSPQQPSQDSSPQQPSQEPSPQQPSQPSSPHQPQPSSPPQPSPEPPSFEITSHESPPQSPQPMEHDALASQPNTPPQSTNSPQPIASPPATSSPVTSPQPVTSLQQPEDVHTPPPEPTNAFGESLNENVDHMEMDEQQKPQTEQDEPMVESGQNKPESPNQELQQNWNDDSLQPDEEKQTSTEQAVIPRLPSPLHEQKVMQVLPNGENQLVI